MVLLVISAKVIYFSIGSEIAGLIADFVSKDSFLLMQFKKFQNSSSKSNDTVCLGCMKLKLQKQKIAVESYTHTHRVQIDKIYLNEK